MFTADNQIVITPDSWIISDTHFFHENIGRYCNRPENWQELIIKFLIIYQKKSFV